MLAVEYALHYIQYIRCAAESRRLLAWLRTWGLYYTILPGSFIMFVGLISGSEGVDLTIVFFVHLRGRCFFFLCCGSFRSEGETGLAFDFG